MLGLGQGKCTLARSLTLFLLREYIVHLNIFETCWGFFQPDGKKEDPEVLFDSEPRLFLMAVLLRPLVTAGNSGLYQAHYTFFAVTIRAWKKTV